MYNDEEPFDFNIDDLFKDPEDNADNNKKDENVVTTKELEAEDNKIMTKEVSKRINEVREKTESETRNKMAKELGFNSYDELVKANEKKLFKEAGLDETDTEDLVNKLVEKRLANDPRMKKLEEYENRDKENFVNSQLKEINELTGSDFKDISQLPEDTLKMWEKTGNLKQAYLATQGESLLLKKKASSENGTTNHLASSDVGNTTEKRRGLTAKEREIYKSVLGDYITDDELSKLTLPNN